MTALALTFGDPGTFGEPQIIDGFADYAEAFAYLADECRDWLILTTAEDDKEQIIQGMDDDEAVGEADDRFDAFFYMIVPSITQKPDDDLPTDAEIAAAVAEGRAKKADEP